MGGKNPRFFSSKKDVVFHRKITHTHTPPFCSYNYDYATFALIVSPANYKEAKPADSASMGASVCYKMKQEDTAKTTWVPGLFPLPANSLHKESGGDGARGR